MSELDRFDPFTWLDEHVLTIAPPRPKRLRSARMPSWARDLASTACAVLVAGAATMSLGHTMSTVPLSSEHVAAVQERTGRDPDQADAKYWRQVERTIAQTARTPELPGEDPELPDYDL